MIRKRTPSFKPRLDVLEDRSLPSTFSVINTGDSGSGSLRQAVLDANAHGNALNQGSVADLIQFNIAADDLGHLYYRDDGVAGRLTAANVSQTTAANDSTIADIDPDWQHSWFTIVPASSLPALTEAVVIDGYSQPGASANTNGPGLGDNAVLRVQLDGTSWETGLVGLTISAPITTVQGLAIDHFNLGIELTGATTTNNRVQGNFIGTDVSGTVALPNAFGISLEASNNTVGGTAPAERNVISGNINPGIELGVINRPLAQGNLIEGNFIGTNASGAVALGNESDGILISQNSGNTIGGTTAAARNIISGNLIDGVGVGTGNFVASDNVIEGNYIGTDVTGTLAVPNRLDGVFDQSSPNTTIGGASPGAGNLIAGNLGNGIYMNFDGNVGNVVQGNRIGTAADGISPLGNGRSGIVVGTNIAILGNAIAFNGEAGVQWVSSGAGNAALGNAIFSNATRGISFDAIRFVPNDPGDADAGPNNLQNFPEVNSASLGAGMLSVTYGVPSAAENSAYPIRVEFFRADAGGLGGQFLLGSDTFTLADAAAGVKTVSFVPARAIAPGDKVVATATDAANNTSEFAPAVTIVATQVADLALIAAPVAGTSAFNKPLTYFLAVTNFGPDAATGVTLTDTLPAGVTLVSATPSTGSVTRSGDVLTFALGDLASHGSATVVIAVTTTATGTLDNRAQVTAGEADSDPTNNTADLVTAVNPGSLQFSAPTYQVDENGGAAVITVTRTGGSTGTVTVDFTTANGTATTGRGGLGADYQKTSGTLTFNDGETSRTISVPIVDDAVVEGPETVGLTLRQQTGGAVLGGPSTAVLTIIDNDPEIGFTQRSSQGSEATGFAGLRVTLSTPVRQQVTVNYAAIGGTATGGGVDYRLPAGQLVFRPGQTTAVIPISIVNDTVSEGNETIVVGLSSPVNAFLGAARVTTYTIVDDEPPPDPAGSTQATSLFVDLATAPRQVLTNTLSKSDSDMYRVDLAQGDFLAIDVDPGKNPLQSSRLVITNPDGTTQMVGASREPDTGVVTGNPAYGFNAPATGTYYLLLTTGQTSAAGYSLELHRLALAQGRQDPAALDVAGPMYAFLKGNTLSITGPTGYGFAIDGAWSQTTLGLRGGLYSTIYTVTGALTLQTALGPIPFDVPAGTLTVATVPNTFGRMFGEVRSIQGRLEGSLGDFVNPFTTRFDKLGASIDLTAPKTDWQIELGSKLRSGGLAQVLNGVPYLTTSAAPSGHFKFGGASFDIPLVDKFGKKPFFAIEPSDPMLYTSFPGVKGHDNIIKDFAFAASLNGRIPFTPLHTPTVSGIDPLGRFFGHVFITDTFEFPVYLATVSVDGAITVNLDANGDGQLLAGNGNADQLFRGDLKALGPVFGDIDVGANAVFTLAGLKGVSLENLAKLFGLDLQLADVTTVFDGPRLGLTVSGTSGLKDPLAGTPFQGFIITNHDTFNAALYGDGRFLVSFSTRQDLLGTQLGFVVTADNSGIRTAITGSVRWVVAGGFIAEATVTGALDIAVDANTGKLHYAGSVRAFGKVKILTGNVSFDVGAEVEGDLLDFDLGTFGRVTIKLP